MDVKSAITTLKDNPDEPTYSLVSLPLNFDFVRALNEYSGLLVSLMNYFESDTELTSGEYILAMEFLMG